MHQRLRAADAFLSRFNCEPYHAGNFGEINSVWWQWTAPATGQVTIDTFGSNYDTLLAINTGDAVNALTAVTYNDDSHSTSQSCVSFAVLAGRPQEDHRVALVTPWRLLEYRANWQTLWHGTFQHVSAAADGLYNHPIRVPCHLSTPHWGA